MGKDETLLRDQVVSAFGKFIQERSDTALIALWRTLGPMLNELVGTAHTDDDEFNAVVDAHLRFLSAPSDLTKGKLWDVLYPLLPKLLGVTLDDDGNVVEAEITSAEPKDDPGTELDPVVSEESKQVSVKRPRKRKPTTVK